MSRHNKALVAGQEFLDKYQAKQQNKAIRREEGGLGNFTSTPTGDLVPSRYLTKHAKERMAERGVSQRDAIKGTSKSGAVVAPDGAIVTVIPEAWAASDRAKKKAEKETKKTDVLVPSADTLPDGHSRAEITLAQSNIMGLVLGAKHCNIQKRIPKQPGAAIRYDVDGNKITIWGPESHVERLLKDIGILEKEAIEKAYDMYGPPIPDGKIPDGQAHRRIVVPDIAIGRVLGKKRCNITKLRDDHTAALINFDGKTGVMHVWGGPSEVDKICDIVAKGTTEAKNAKKKEDAKRAKGAKLSNERRMKDFEADMKAFRKAKPVKNSCNSGDSRDESYNIRSEVNNKKQKEVARRKNITAATQEDMRAEIKEKNKKKQQKRKAAKREKLEKANS